MHLRSSISTGGRGVTGAYAAAYAFQDHHLAGDPPGDAGEAKTFLEKRLASTIGGQQKGHGAATHRSEQQRRACCGDRDLPAVVGNLSIHQRLDQGIVS